MWPVKRSYQLSESLTHSQTVMYCINIHQLNAALKMVSCRIYFRINRSALTASGLHTKQSRCRGIYTLSLSLTHTCTVFNVHAVIGWYRRWVRRDPCTAAMCNAMLFTCRWPPLLVLVVDIASLRQRGSPPVRILELASPRQSAGGAAQRTLLDESFLCSCARRAGAPLSLFDQLPGGRSEEQIQRPAFGFLLL